MPSLQSRFFRLLTKRVVGPKFRRADKSIPEYRKLNELIIKSQKVPAGTEIGPILANGVAAEWVRTPDAQTDNAILYLHGGAFIMGSPATHRELAARLSAVAKAGILVIDYRLAPEHPFPAAMQDALSAYRCCWIKDTRKTVWRLAEIRRAAG